MNEVNAELGMILAVSREEFLVMCVLLLPLSPGMAVISIVSYVGSTFSLTARSPSMSSDSLEKSECTEFTVG